MAWPAYVSKAFEAIPKETTDESLFYGPYNALLGFLFPPTDHYIISPQRKHHPEGWSIDFSTVFIVYREKHPVFFLEVKLPAVYEHRSSRATADNEMRIRFFDLADAVRVPTLHGLSALGTRLCLYTYHSVDNTLLPTGVKADKSLMNDVAPAS